MTSVRKIEANRRNSRKSSGPRTAAGKAIASRNALRHGLSALTHLQPLPTPEIEQFARALSGDDNNPALFAQAVQIAQNEMALQAIRAHQVHVVERLREEPFQAAFAKKDNSLELGLARFMKGWLAAYEIEKQLPKILEKYKDQLPPPLTLRPKPPNWEELPDWMVALHTGDWDELVPIRLKALWEEPPEINEQILELARKQLKEREGDQYEALEAAIVDFVRIERYLRRTWSRQKRAIREFMNIKVAARSVDTALPAEERVL
jgi:hypothetical protein